MNVIDLPRASARDPPLCDLPVSRRKCTIAPDGAAIAFSGDFAEAAHSLGRRGVCREEPRRGLHGAERVDDAPPAAVPSATSGEPPHQSVVTALSAEQSHKQVREQSRVGNPLGVFPQESRK